METFLHQVSSEQTGHVTDPSPGVLRLILSGLTPCCHHELGLGHQSALMVTFEATALYLAAVLLCLWPLRYYLDPSGSCRAVPLGHPTRVVDCPII